LTFDRVNPKRPSAMYTQIPLGLSRYDTTRYLANAFWHRDN